MNRHRLTTEIATLVADEPSPVRRRVVLLEQYGDNFSAAFLSLTALEFVAQELGERSLQAIRRRHRQLWLTDLQRQESAVVDYGRERAWPK